MLLINNSTDVITYVKPTTFFSKYRFQSLYVRVIELPWLVSSKMQSLEPDASRFFVLELFFRFESWLFVVRLSSPHFKKIYLMKNGKETGTLECLATWQCLYFVLRAVSGRLQKVLPSPSQKLFLFNNFLTIASLLIHRIVFGVSSSSRLYFLLNNHIKFPNISSFPTNIQHEFPTLQARHSVQHEESERSRAVYFDYRASWQCHRIGTTFPGSLGL